MFIKFGDNTKKIIVKKSKEESDNVDNQQENAIFLDSDEEKDRRIKVLKEYSEEEAVENKE